MTEEGVKEGFSIYYIHTINVIVLVVLMSNLPVYTETKNAEELQAGALHNHITWVNIRRPKEYYYKQPANPPTKCESHFG